MLSTLCYIKNAGKTLMLHRNKKDKDIHKGKWNGLGGKFMSGETPEECVIREVREESGLEIVKPVLRGVMTFPRFKDEEDWYVFLFTSCQFSGDLIESDEGALAWIEDAKILDLNLWEGDKYFLKGLEQEKFFTAKFIYENKELKNYEVIFY